MVSMKAKIISTGSFLPKKVLTNADLEKMVDTSNTWIVERTGIETRHIASENEFTSTMGAEAAKKALEKANLSASDIDMIIVATLTPDYTFPSTACLIQEMLQAKNAAAFDFQTACSGYIYGLSIAKAFVEMGMYKNVLLIASEKLSSIVNYKDRTTCVLFGDGATAAIVSNRDYGLIIDSVCLGADGSVANLLTLPAGGCRHPASIKTIEANEHFIKMEGKELFKHAVRRMIQASEECLKMSSTKAEDISWLIPHQANLRIIEAMAKRFSNVPDEKVFKDVIRKCGNTSASSVGLGLDELLENNLIKNKEKVLLTAFGAGLTWGAALLTKLDN
jgi:3-oxoacyl-[acyl-carrier-protein] synthase-3